SGGAVGDTVLLHGTQPSPTFLGRSVRTWLFRPATDGPQPVNAHVLAIALIRPPQLFDDPAAGSKPADYAVPSDQLPYPTTVRRPRYPPLAIGDAMVLVEVLVGVDGRVRAAAVVGGTAGVHGAAPGRES